MHISSKLGLFLGPILFLIILNLPLELVSEQGDMVIATAVWMVIWWITEAVSISVLALATGLTCCFQSPIQKVCQFGHWPGLRLRFSIAVII